MSAIIDLSNLHDMTGNDKELESMLFAEFIRTFDEYVQNFPTLLEGDNLEWKSAMHALKGVALNLGANLLGELCKLGQEIYEGDISKKRALLKEISSAYADVRSHLQSLT